MSTSNPTAADDEAVAQASPEEKPRSVTRRKRTPPVKAWAAVGAILLLVELVLVGKWIAGPSLMSVPSGPSVPPTWMKVVLNTWQVGGNLVMLFCFYVFLVRPWRRDRRVTSDGLLCLALFITSVYDPLSRYFHHWFTYNAYLLNFGSILQDIPGIQSVNKPGATAAWPVLVIPAGYVYMPFVGILTGLWLMRRARRQWAGIGTLGAVVVCFVAMMLIDIVLEGVIFMPLGFWTYPGGHWALFGANSYWKFPLQGAIVTAAFLTAMTCFRYFTDDKGRTIVERGIDDVRVTPRQRTALRFLAVLAATQVLVLVLWHGPQGLAALRPDRWPRDLQNRSYLTEHICGAGTTRVCGVSGIP